MVWFRFRSRLRFFTHILRVLEIPAMFDIEMYSRGVTLPLAGRLRELWELSLPDAALATSINSIVI